jgi:CRISPR-associated exonuclease Cas4
MHVPLLVALILGGLGLWFWLRSLALQRQTGLPRGRLIYVDTGAWDRCERPLFSNRYRLTGRPDYLVSRRGSVVPVEVKSGAAPSQPYAAHVLQLGAYCLLVEEQEGQAPSHGILKYHDRAFEIDYTPGLRAEVIDTLDDIRRDLHARDVSRNHNDRARCQNCGYRNRCDQRLS